MKVSLPYKKRRFEPIIKYKGQTPSAKALRWMKANWPNWTYQKFIRLGLLYVRGGRTGCLYIIGHSSLFRKNETTGLYQHLCVIPRHAGYPNDRWYPIDKFDRFAILREYIIHSEDELVQRACKSDWRKKKDCNFV